MAKNDVSRRHHVPWPTLGWLLKNPVSFVAVGFGVGLIRPGSGTWGTVLALVLWWPLQHWLAAPALGVLLVVLAVLGIWICEHAGKAVGVADHVGVVWDEIVAMWLLLWVLPSNIWVVIAAFVLFRIFDTTKPAPIAWLDEHFKGGLGVMLDDVVAALYAGIPIAVWWYFLRPAWQGAA
jgi:phosphatidylglycerophosphatase A